MSQAPYKYEWRDSEDETWRQPAVRESPIRDTSNLQEWVNWITGQRIPAYGERFYRIVDAVGEAVWQGRGEVRGFLAPPPSIPVVVVRPSRRYR